MFFTYLRRELRRRSRQAVVIAVGLGIGIGLVVTVSSASAGVKNAQTQVLHSLYGVGTDATVTQTPTTSSFGPQRFGFRGNGTRPAPGSTFSSTHIRRSPGLAPLRQTRVGEIGRIDDVNAATGSLSLNETSISGTLPNFGSGGIGASSPAPGGSSGLQVNTTSIVGLQPSSSGVGPLTPSEVTKGQSFTTADQSDPVAIVSTSYASQHNLVLGSTLSLNGNNFKVIGLASEPSSSSSTDVFIPLGEAQRIAGLSGEVTTIYVSVNSAANVGHVQSEIQHLLPAATVTTAADLAKQVTGSLSSAANLVTDLGKWLAVAVLLASFLVAALFMLTAVSRRVREFGTLKAIGWRTRRIMEQVMGEGLVQGVAGAVVGILLGILGTELVSVFAPTLSATVGPSFATNAGAPGPQGGFPGGGFASRFANGAGGARPRGFGARFADATHTVLVHLGASIQGGTLGLAIGLALLGGLLAGAVGSWRAARMRPAEALRQVG